MTSLRSVDLKCSETLRESPPPPPPAPPPIQLQYGAATSSSSAAEHGGPGVSGGVFASSTLISSSSANNTPSHHPHHRQPSPAQLPTGVPPSISFGQFLTQQQAAAVNLLKKFESQRGGDSGNTITTTKSGSRSGLSSSSLAASPSSTAFAGANAACSSKPSPSSNLSPQQQQQHTASVYPQQSSHTFPGFTLPSAGTGGIWPLVQNVGPLSHHLPSSSTTNRQGPFPGIIPSPTKLQQNVTAASATLPLALSPSKVSAGTGGAGGGSGSVRPLTLHVSTSRGPAVLQLQQSTTTTSAKQPVKLLPAAGIATTGTSSSLQHASSQQHTVGIGGASTALRPSLTSGQSSVPNIGGVGGGGGGGSVATRVPVLRPSPVHPMAAASAALLSQLASSASTFGLVDPHNPLQHHQHLQAAAALLRSPLINACPGPPAPHVVGLGQQNPAQGNSALGRTVIVSVSGSQQVLTGAGPHAATITGGLSAHPPPSNTISGSAPSTPTTNTTAAAAPYTSATPSPTRPSILRKRQQDVSNGTGSYGHSSKRALGYESMTLAKHAKDKGVATPDSDQTRASAVLTSTNTTIENPEAGNSNQSSSASTISAISAPDSGNGYSGANSSHATMTGAASPSPSPRKRPRKQQLSELASSRGYGSEDEETTNKLNYCEPIEEETVVMGPSGVSGIGDDGYRSASSTHHRLAGHSSLYLSTLPLEQALVGGGVHSMKDGSVKSEYSGSGLLNRTGSRERQFPSFDQLQQHIEQQRKHVPEFRPRPSLLANYELSYDSKRYHFCLHEDVKVRDDKQQQQRLSIVELSNQKEILQRICGWKVYLMAVQFDNLDRDERTNLDDLNDIHALLNSWSSFEEDDEGGDGKAESSKVVRRNTESMAKEMDRLKEVVLSNVQRLRVIREHIDDGKRQLLSILKYKQNAEKLINKYSTKRATTRRKERGKNGAAALE